MKRTIKLIALASAMLMCAFAFIIIQSVETIELAILDLLPGLWNMHQILIRLVIGCMLVSLPLSVLFAFQRIPQQLLKNWVIITAVLCIGLFALISMSLPWSSKSTTLLFVTATLSVLVAFLVSNNSSNLSTKGKSILNITFVSIAILSGMVSAFVLAPSYPIYFDKIEESNPELSQRFESSNLMQKDKSVTVFASVNCPHCHRVISYLNVAIGNGEINAGDVIIHFPEGAATVSNYLNQFDTPPAHNLISKEQFIEYTAGRYPLTYFSNEGKVKATWHTKGFTYSDIPIIKSLLNN